ncbi:MAG: hypothetical protein GWP08_07090 [Nitrospiraceae bacterium]|nr:hypothetical protein [Nitrospiraceae bacterium]
MSRRLLVALLALSTVAAARGPDGALDILHTPNNGLPVIVLPGTSFDAVARAGGALHLVNEQSGAKIPLDAQWVDVPGPVKHAQCTVPGDTPPGAYALEVADGDRVDRNRRAVYVRESFPDHYAIAHLTDTHIGSARHPRPAADIFRDAIQAVNNSSAAFCVITGDLTDDGKPEQFKRFLDILDTCAIPTFVCPGNHDRLALNYENTFGLNTYLFWFGSDAYLSFDTKDFNVATELGRQDADLHVFRRAAKPARWTIGLTHRYEPDMGMRSQLTLFVDNPLDHLIYGHTHRANREDETTVPWGTTQITVTPAAVDGQMRWIDISPLEIKPRAPERVAQVE